MILALTTKEYAPGDTCLIVWLPVLGKKIDPPQPGIVLRKATVEEYESYWESQGYGDKYRETVERWGPVPKDKIYEVSTD